MKPGNIYAVNHGTYIGQFFTYIDKEKQDNIFFSIPDMSIVCVSNLQLHKAIKDNIITFQEQLPDSVYQVILQQYKETANGNKSNNRRKQPTS